MKAREKWRAELRLLSRSEWARFLDEHSGLPGPRANTELAIAYAELADWAQIDTAIGSSDEYTAMCGTVALGARATDPGALTRLRQLASDSRWRVREAVAMGLQLLGDASFDELEQIVEVWVDDHDPLVQRAAAAAICEPRLLGTSHAAEVAVDICVKATNAIARQPRDSRRGRSLRVLRQTLGYCWSVAVAANPEQGLPVFQSLETSDSDVAWIVAQNLRKKRLTNLSR